MMKIAKAFTVIILVLLKTQGVLSEKKEEGRRQFIKRAERSSSKLRKDIKRTERSSSKLRKDIKRTERSSSKLRKEGDKSVSKRLAVSDDPGEPPMSLEDLRTHYYQKGGGQLGHFCSSHGQCLSPLNCDHFFCGGRVNGWDCKNDDECQPGVSCAGSELAAGAGYCGGGWNLARCNHDDHCINICKGFNLYIHHLNGRCGRAAEDGESCTEDRECINQCLGNICMLPVGIGGTCASSPQCQGNLECSSRTCVLLRYPGQSCSAPHNVICGGGQQCSSGSCSGRNNRDRCNSRYQCNSRSCSYFSSRCSSKPLQGNEPMPWSRAHSRCEGYCNIDNDCIGSLICFQRNGHTSVPGCDDDRSRSNMNRGFCIER